MDAQKQAKLIERFNRRRSASFALIERMLGSYLRPFIGLLLLGIFTNMLVAAMTGALPWLIQRAIDDIFIGQNQTMLIIIPLAIIGSQFFRGIMTYISNIILRYVGQQTTANLQTDLTQIILHGDLAAIAQRHSADYLSLFMTDCIRMRDTVNTTVIALARDLLTVIALLVTLFIMNWQLAALFVLIVMPLGMSVTLQLGRLTRKSSRLGLEETAELSTVITEMLRGLRIVKAYAQEDAQITRARTAINNVLYFTMKAFRARATVAPVLEILGGLAVGAIIYFGGTQSASGALSAGEFMGFVAALLMVYNPLRAVANVQTAMQEGVAAAQRIFSLLDRPVHIHDHPDAQALDIKQGNIRFEHVNFHYSDEDVPAISDMSFHVEGGQSVALVGASGAGKSTLLNLILRFFDIDAGVIKIDGQDIRTVHLTDLRAATALVTQDPFLFDETISHNIAFGCENITQEQIEQAARLAAAHAFICDLPHGYETRVGESGLRLSGGQKQRIAIARAILKNAPILLLDEATSALDTTSEAHVQKAIATLMQGRTALIIAHRLSTIIHCDKILVLDKGRIVEAGTHEQLLQKKAIYYTLFHAQFKETK